MMQEDELVVKDTLNIIDINTMGGREVQPFTISGMLSNLQNTDYYYSKFEVFVTLVVMLSTISGGFLEGYTSPAIPSLLGNSTTNGVVATNSSITNTGSTFKTSTIASSTLQNSRFSVPLVRIQSTLQPPTDTSTSSSTVLPSVKSTFEIITITSSTLDSTDETDIITTNRAADIGLNDTNGTVINPISELPNKMNKSISKRDITFNSNYSTTEKSTEITSDEEGELTITEDEASWLGSLLLLGACLGAFLSSWIVSLGRRHAILFSALPRLCGWILIATATAVPTLYAGRFLCGFSLGMVSSAAPIYISEVSHPSLRGSLNCLVQLGVNIGIFLAALFGTFMGWEALAILGAVFVLFYLVPSVAIPNSPSWLVSRGKEDEARQILKKLRGNAISIEEELQQIITLAQNNKKQDGVRWLDLVRERRTLLPLSVVILVTFVNRFSGYNAIITYCATFVHAAVPFVSQYAAAASICFVQIIATGFSITVVDKWGRRKLLLLSMILMGVSLVSIAIFNGFLSDHSAGATLTIMATMMFVGSYSVGVGPLTWVLLGELFPLDSRDKAACVVSVLNWLSAFLVTKTFFTLEGALGLGGTCCMYASVCFVGAGLSYLLVPETKGRTLAEIEAHFNYSQLSWKNLAPKVDRALSSILEHDTAATIDTYSTFQ